MFKSKMFNEIANFWLKDRKNNIKEQSYNKYINVLNKYVFPYFNKIKIKKVNNKLINDYFKNINYLSYSSKKTILFIIKSILYYSYMNKYIRKNIEINIVLKKEKAKINYFTIREQKIIEEYIYNNINLYNIGLLICLYTGLRIGEICGLKWEDIDLNNKIIYINKTVQRIQDIGNKTTKKVLSSPKSNSSNRIIPIPEFLIDILNKYKTNNHYYLLTNNTDYQEPRNYERYYKNLLSVCNIKYINFHSLRHTFATRSIESGMDIKTLSEILGHASYHTTLNTYIHSSIDQKRDCLNKLAININQS